MFGMHENSNITFQKAESSALLSTTLSLQPRDAAGASGATPDEIVAEMAKAFYESLPELLDKSRAATGTFDILSTGVMDSLDTVLSQEIERFNKLLQVMHHSLHEIGKAICGEVVMSEQLDKMYSAFLVNAVPDLWHSCAYPSLKPLASWFKDLQERVEFMRDWLENGKPTAFWMSGFFFPQVFMRE